MSFRPIRQSQLISPFGIGAMVDFRNDESLMAAGLDAWPKAKEDCPKDWLVHEERLEARLQMNHFRLAPDFRTDFRDPLSNQKVPFVRFPTWHYCPRCGYMSKVSIFGGRKRCIGTTGMCKGLPESRRPYLIPVRIVAVCPKGHIEDFPFMEWVHRGSPPEGKAHELKFLASRSSASLAGIKIQCSCGEIRSLAGAFEFSEKESALHKIGYDCHGNRPWLGEIDGTQVKCGEMLRVVQRGASNVYFPSVASSIYLPLWAEQEEKIVIDVLEDPLCWDILTSGLEDGSKIDRSRCEMISRMKGVDPNKLCKAAQNKLDGGKSGYAETDSEEQFRYQEYVAISKGRGCSDSDLLVDVIDGSEYGQFDSVIKRVCLIRKLRETRVLVGFSRLLPAGSAEVPNTEQLCLDREVRWRPAAVVRGEGIFIELREEAIAAWLNGNNDISHRIERLSKTYNDSRLPRGLPVRQVDPRFVMIHTLAHALIGQLSFACGYGSASLRERLYCNIETDSVMNGLLIYTASGDSEGTLGGLVRQGEPPKLPRIITDALSRIEWCSSDPVCIESTGQGIDNANLAACHGCVLLPETCCEEGNRLLDRVLLVGATNSPQVGFFSKQDLLLTRTL